MRILIADDHPVLRQGLKQILSSDLEAAVVGEATTGDEALELAASSSGISPSSTSPCRVETGSICSAT